MLTGKMAAAPDSDYEVSLNPWLLLSVAIAAEVTATLALQYAEGFSRSPMSAVAVVGYVVAFAFFGASLQAGLPVGFAYAVWAAVGIAAVAVLGRALFGHHLATPQVVGVGVIISGVLMVTLGAKAPYD